MTLKEFLDKYKIRREELAEKVGINKSTLFLYIGEKRQPRVDVAIKIKDAAGMSDEDFFEIFSK